MPIPFSRFLILCFLMMPMSAQFLDLNGAGSTAIEPLQNQLALRFQPTVSTALPYRIAYNATGSGQGKAMLIQKQVDFAWSESPLTTEEQLIAPNLLMLPMYATGVAIIYNLPGLDAFSPALNLTVQLLVAMYKGEVRNWGDERILSLNPFLAKVSNAGGQLANASITRFVRAEASGTTSILTDAFQVFDTSWTYTGSNPDWPNPDGRLVHAKGSSGLAMSVIWNPYSIGYVSYDSAILYGLTPVQLVSASNTVQKLTNDAVFKAISTCKDLSASTKVSQAVATYSDPQNAYPIVGFSFMIIPTTFANCTKAYGVQKYLSYLSGDEARGFAWTSHFIAPSAHMLALIADRLNQLKCVDGASVVLVASLQNRFESLGDVKPTSSSSSTFIILVVVIVVATLLSAVAAFVVWRKIHIRRKLRKFPNGKVTFVFTDIQDSTRLWSAYPMSFPVALEMHNTLVRELLIKFEGHEVKTHGDSFMIAFASSHKAVGFAIELQRRLLDVDWPAELLKDDLLAEKRAIPDATEGLCEPNARAQYALINQVLWRGLRVRIGMHCGENIRPRYNGGAIDYFGTVVNTAARVSALAQGGQILMTMLAYDDFFLHNSDPPIDARMIDLGVHPLKGLPPTHVVSICPPELDEREFESLEDLCGNRPNSSGSSPCQRSPARVRSSSPRFSTVPVGSTIGRSVSAESSSSVASQGLLWPIRQVHNLYAAVLRRVHSESTSSSSASSGSTTLPGSATSTPSKARSRPPTPHIITTTTFNPLTVVPSHPQLISVTPSL